MIIKDMLILETITRIAFCDDGLSNLEATPNGGGIVGTSDIAVESVQGFYTRKGGGYLLQIYRRSDEEGYAQHRPLLNLGFGKRALYKAADMERLSPIGRVSAACPAG